MKNLRKTVWIVMAIVAFFAVAMLAVLAASPGSEEDPVVSLSYLTEQVIPELKAYVEETLGRSGAGGYEVVILKAGDRVIADASGQLILRQGSAKIVATAKGGVADVTAGVDLPDGAAMPANHLLIVPISDGRGLEMTTNGIVMISGVYTLQ